MALKPVILFFFLFLFLIVTGILPSTCHGSIYRIPHSAPPSTPAPSATTTSSTVSISNWKKMIRAKADYGKVGGHLISSSSTLNVMILPRGMRVPPSGPSKRHNSIEVANSP